MLGVLRIARLLCQRQPAIKIHPMSRTDRLFWERLHERRQRDGTTKD
jgi:hypothetical protein